MNFLSSLAAVVSSSTGGTTVLRQTAVHVVTVFIQRPAGTHEMLYAFGETKNKEGPAWWPNG